MSIFRRGVSILKSMGNPRYFRYRSHHATNRYIKKKTALQIAARNRRDYAVDDLRELKIETYDGSGQAVHPDIAIYEGKLYFAVTPYPYGMEEYENPCVYVGKDLNSLQPLSQNPIAFQGKHCRGNHLSDPCLFVYDGHICCAFRESERDKNGDNTIIKYSEYINGKWSESKIITSDANDKLLSPALIENAGNIVMFHVRENQSRIEADNALILSYLNADMEAVGSKSSPCVGVPQGYRLWHITVCYQDCYKADVRSGNMIGLFLMKRNGEKGDPFKLFYASGTLDGGWIIGKEVYVEEKIKKVAKCIYKSCFIPHTNKILLSFRDTHDRYRMTFIDSDADNVFHEENGSK